MEFSPSVSDAINTAAAEYGIDPAFMGRVAEIESSGAPSLPKGSHRGLFQLSPEVWQKFGSGDIYNPLDNARAAARYLAANRARFVQRFGRDPSQTELYLAHQQGMGGLTAHLTNPDAPAWRNMAGTADGRARGEQWAKQAIWGNIPDPMKLLFGDVRNVTGRNFIDLWRAIIEGGLSTDQPFPFPRPRPPSAPRGSLDQPRNDLADGDAPPGPSNLLGPPQPSLADGDGAFPAALSQMQTAPQQVPAPSASPIDVPVPPALQPLVPFFFPRGLNTGDTQAWPSAGAGDRSGTLDIYNSTVPRLPSGQFGGAPMPGGPFDALQVNRADNSNAPAAFPSQTQMIPQQAPAPASIEALLPPALRPLLPLFFAPDGSPTGFGRGLSAPGPTAEMTPQADQVGSTGALSAPSGGAEMMPQQDRAPSPPWIDAVPPELKILVPFFFPQGFDNGRTGSL